MVTAETLDQSLHPGLTEGGCDVFAGSSDEEQEL